MFLNGNFYNNNIHNNKWRQRVINIVRKGNQDKGEGGLAFLIRNINFASINTCLTDAAKDGKGISIASPSNILKIHNLKIFARLKYLDDHLGEMSQIDLLLEGDLFLADVFDKLSPRLPQTRRAAPASIRLNLSIILPVRNASSKILVREPLWLPLKQMPELPVCRQAHLDRVAYRNKAVTQPKR
ncbi:hypothetical protein TNCV_239201 [Trichonephila clavipes]|nr:hypothetical protein TNCV_239201 [Trichonephila clavipes]